MLTTIEAEIDVTGKVTLLEPVKITRRSRAILTLLDDENVGARGANSEEEAAAAERRFARHFGGIGSGDADSADNEKIDADLIRISENPNDE